MLSQGNSSLFSQPHRGLTGEDLARAAAQRSRESSMDILNKVLSFITQSSITMCCGEANKLKHHAGEQADQIREGQEEAQQDQCAPVPVEKGVG